MFSIYKNANTQYVAPMGQVAKANHRSIHKIQHE
jgi:hypothetical protein